MSEIRVSIFEDHKAVRQVLEELINTSTGFVLTGAFPNASQVIRKLESNLPDVVLMDIQMPGRKWHRCRAHHQATLSFHPGDRTDCV